MCDYLDVVRSRTVAAGAAAAAAAVAVLVAVGLNGGFFTAPGAPAAMIVAGAAATAASAALKNALDRMAAGAASGCVSPQCSGKFENLRNAIAAAATTLAALATSCYAIAAVSWIPWIGAVPMLVVYGALVIAAAAFATVAKFHAALADCASAVATARGGLEAGEKWSDAWVLRLSPGREHGYVTPEGDTPAIVGTEVSDVHLQCVKVAVGNWHILAVARVVGSVDAMSFEWRLNGKAVPSAHFEPRGTRSTLSLVTPSLGERIPLTVTARDSSGKEWSKSAELDLLDFELRCKLTLSLPPVRFRTPAIPWELDGLRPAVNAFSRIAETVLGRIPRVRAAAASSIVK